MEVSKQFKQSQLKAAVKVNSEMLKFYWCLGRDIALMSKEAGYGSDFYNAISADLKDIFPDVKSFSTTNLKYMRYFYEMYPEATENHPQFVDDLSQTENRPQAVDDLEASSQPMGIAVYDINRFLPEEYRSSLPTIEEIEAELAAESKDGKAE